MPNRENDTYEIYVKFTRSRSEDIEAAEHNFPGVGEAKALLLQFGTELQVANNEGTLTGSWNILGTSLTPHDMRAAVRKADWLSGIPAEG